MSKFDDVPFFIPRSSKLADGPILEDFEPGTVAWLIQRYIEEIGTMPGKAFGVTHLYHLRRLQKMPIGRIQAHALRAADIVAHVKMRRLTVGAATSTQDLAYLRGPLAYAKHGFGMDEISIQALADAKPLLDKFQLVGKSRPRERRPTTDEYARLLAYFREHYRGQIPMAAILEFAVLTARRISEICRLRWCDVNFEDRTCIVRDMKDPKHKIGNDHEFPLLGRSFEIVMEQPRVDERIFRCRSQSVTMAYIRAKHHLGITDLRFHDNRREATSRLFEQGYSVPEVMVVSGHKNPKELIRSYTKLKASDLHRGPANGGIQTCR